jgi:hypothetical protein
LALGGRIRAQVEAVVRQPHAPSGRSGARLQEIEVLARASEHRHRILQLEVQHRLVEVDVVRVRVMLSGMPDTLLMTHPAVLGCVAQCAWMRSTGSARSSMPRRTATGTPRASGYGAGCARFRDDAREHPHS